MEVCLVLPISFFDNPKRLELHPEPRHILKLWEAFAENVNPLTKIIHAPTLQQRIIQAAWSLESASRPLEAVMFGVYALGITSLKPSDCVDWFGETKQALLRRYRSGALQALAASGVLLTRDLEVLQALVLFIVGSIQGTLAR